MQTVINNNLRSECAYMSNIKNDVEVVINNKIYTICGFESNDYIQKIATYINGKYTEFKACSGYNTLNPEMKGIMLDINIADDYFKAKELSEEYLAESNEKSKELFEIKHELITCQTKNDSLLRECEQIKDEMEQEQRKVLRLEAEIDELKKQLEIARQAASQRKR